MSHQPSLAVRLDRAVDDLFAGAPPRVAAAAAGVGTEHRSLVDVAATLRAGLGGSVIGPRFEARLGARLAAAAHAPWILRHPGRLIVTGAVGSAVGVGVTAYAVWRSARRQPNAAHRLLHR